MKSLRRALLVIVSLAMLAGILPAALADDAGSVPGTAWEGFDLSAETFGPLRIGMPATELREALGEWTQAGEPALWGADGLEHWDVSYDLPGLTVGLARAPGDEASASVYSILAVGPLDWKTARGLGIGDTVELVKSLYGEVIDPEWDTDANQGVLIGSLYGGILAGLKEGAIVSLYLGALAE
jgi:hypothetical protein